MKFSKVCTKCKYMYLSNVFQCLIRFSSSCKENFHLLGINCCYVCFAEAKSAAEAGLKTTLVVREGNEPLTDDDKKTYNTISSFSELLAETNDAETPAKK